jgi:hypothetical protein
MRKLLIHAGYPKAASTTLQNQLFLSLHKQGAINFLGRAFESDYVGAAGSRDIYKDWFLAVTRNEADASEAGFRRIFPEIASDKLNVFSEGLFVTNENHPDKFVMAQRVHDFFAPRADNIRILFVLRSQISLIMSYYVQRYAKAKDATFAEFLHRNFKSAFPGAAKIFYAHELVKSYADVFGRDNIRIVFFEDIFHARSQFCSELGAALDLSPSLIDAGLGSQHLNVSRKDGGSYVVKKQGARTPRAILNLLLNKVGLATRRLEIKIPSITTEQEEKIFEFFRDNNRRLAAEYNLDCSRMKQYRYL